MSFLTFSQGAGVGFVLGLVFALVGAGGGGLTVPALLYLLHQRLEVATGTALAIVSGAAVAGTWRNWREGRVVPGVVVPVALSSVLGAVAGTLLSPLVAERWRMLMFVAALLASGVSMLRPRREAAGDARPMALPGLVALGLMLGVFTGFLGVGGGFLLVPALTRLARLPLRQAIGSSLAIIGLSSLTGAVTHATQGHVVLAVLLPVGTGAVVGALVGSRLSGTVPERALRVTFAVLVFALAAVMARSALGL